MASDDEACAALEKVLGVASTAVDRGLQAVADIYIKDDWSPEVMVKKTQYTMDKHEQIIRSALQRAADALIQLWVVAVLFILITIACCVPMSIILYRLWLGYR